MSNNFPTFSRISIKILSILVNIVLSIKSLGLDVILFRILTIVRLCFSNVLGRFFSFKNCFTPRVLARKPERAVAFHSGQSHFTAGSCVSERTGCKKPARSERLLSQSDQHLLANSTLMT